MDGRRCARVADGRHAHEVFDGVLIVSPAPGFPHQRAAYRLHRSLEDAAHAAGAAVEIMDAVNVEIPSGLAVPDLAIVEVEASRAGRSTTIPVPYLVHSDPARPLQI